MKYLLATAAIALLMGTGAVHADKTFQEKGSWEYSAVLECRMMTIKDYPIHIEYTPVGSLSFRVLNKSWKMAEHTIVEPVFVQFGSDPWIEVVGQAENLVNKEGQFSTLQMYIRVPVNRMTEGGVIRFKLPKETWTVQLDNEISDAFQRCANAIDTLKEK